MASYTITEFLGDGIGAELSQVVHTVADVLPCELKFQAVDLSLANRQSQGYAVYDEALESIRATRFALKYPTSTEGESPNAILRRKCDFTVIHRPVATIPGVPSNFTREFDLEIIRVATGGTYADPGRAIGKTGAVSVRIIERGPIEQAAVFAFELARKMGKQVTTSSKYTIQQATDGLFESIVDEVHDAYLDISHRKELFDALLAKVIMQPERFEIILVLNEYGDFLSDMACGLAGSLGIGASGSFSFNEFKQVDLGMFDPVGGTAPDIAGKGLANPTAILLAMSQLLCHLGEVSSASVIKSNTLQMLKAGITTRDLGGRLNTCEFTQELIHRIETDLKQDSSDGKVMGKHAHT